MAVQNIATLKSYFETGDKPTEEQFSDLIDTIFSRGAGDADRKGVEITFDPGDGPVVEIGNAEWANLGTKRCGVQILDANGQVELIPYQFTPIANPTKLVIDFGAVLSETKYINLY